MSIRTRHLAVAGASLALAVTGLAATPTEATTGTHRATQRLEATLRPSGDPDGSGEAHFTLNKARTKVCATVTWQHIEAPTPPTSTGSPTAGSWWTSAGSVTGGSHCATGVPKRTIAAILRHPGRYYFNVHNPTYPAGAIQGTLRR